MSQRFAALAVALLTASAGSVVADEMKHSAPMNAKDLKWGPVPPVLPKGAEVAVLSGDPFAAGSYVLRLKFPKGYKIAAHHHPTTESITVLSGNFHIGMGDKFDDTKGMELKAGGYGEAPPKMNHYAWASTPTIIQIHGQGPFAITYVDPADDPSKPAPAKK